METPDVIYIDGRNAYANLPVFSTCCNIKYIRADLPELTLEDIKELYNIVSNLVYKDGYSIPISNAGYEEVLRKFNEYRAKK